MTLGELDDLLKELHDAEFASQMAKSVFVDELTPYTKQHWLDKLKIVEEMRERELHD